jgi:hypothetical protein
MKMRMTKTGMRMRLRTRTTDHLGASEPWPLIARY